MTPEELETTLRERGRADDILALLEKLGFTRAFVAQSVLSKRDAVTVAQTAMEWLGMPNKHDRKKTRQLFDALSDAGLLQPEPSGESWRSTVS